MARASLLALLAGTLGCAQILGIPDRQTCADPEVYCDGACVDVSVDGRNCGGCGNSCDGAACVDSQCVDPSCTKEGTTGCTPGTATAECLGLDCVEFSAYTTPVCLRPCRTTDDCPSDLFCAPLDGAAYSPGFPAFSLVGGHCVNSFCGGGIGTSNRNGTQDGACELGGDAYLVEGAVETQPGSCLMLTATIGLCLRGGDVARGQSCTFEPGHCMLREDVTSCAVGDICTGTTGSATGTCGRLCDPRAAGGCDNGQTCLAFSGGANVAGVCR